ncbi:MAG: efflux RND transporter periplasmic adaptor subunit [Desulfomonilaceae bacterium]|nr:efflux RND transporter periplasmic adaptor subunit [Desulfomonilaceae bacterium]
MILPKSVLVFVGLLFTGISAPCGQSFQVDLRAALPGGGKELGGSQQAGQVRPAREDDETFRTEAAVIRPYRQATVGAEVPGVVELRNFAEGDLVDEGSVIFKISPERYKLSVEKTRQRVLALEASLERAEQELKLKEYLLSHNAATRQEVLKVRAEARIAEHQMNEAKKDHEFAVRDMEKSFVRAPFEGHIVAFYREPHEAVQRFEQLFLIADTSKVYAVVNVPETRVTLLTKGSLAVFVRPSGDRFSGTVAMMGKAIDPASRTKKVHVLIENAQGKLEMGMLGAVDFVPKQRGNP